jgi:hypothetical protein
MFWKSCWFWLNKTWLFRYFGGFCWKKNDQRPKKCDIFKNWVLKTLWMDGLWMDEFVNNTWATNWAYYIPHNLSFIKNVSQIYRYFLQIAQKSQPTFSNIRLHSVSVYQKFKFLGLPELGKRIWNEVPNPAAHVGSSYEDFHSIGRVLWSDRSDHRKKRKLVSCTWKKSRESQQYKLV